jgi:peptidoglycan glycosyltransferase
MRRNIKTMLVIFAAMFVVLSVYLLYTVNAYGTRWFSNPYNTRLENQKNNIIAGDIKDRDGTTLAGTNTAGDRTYIDDSSMRKATAHAVGDNYGQTFGAENFFSKYLLGFDQSLLERFSRMVSEKPSYGSDVYLTINAELCDYIYAQMGDYKGAVVVMNYKTGEVYAKVSKPAFDPKYVAEYLSGKRALAGGAMVNRVTSGRYTPGSVFKIVTAVAALRYIPYVESRTFQCGGPLAFDRQTGKYLPAITIDEDEQTKAGISGEYRVLRDYNGDYHGEIDFVTAFNKSCNHVFAVLAMEIGADRLARVAKELGVGDEFLFADIVTASSSYEKPNSDVDLAWSGIGQYTDIMTPLHMCMIVAGIANEGVMMEPELLWDVRTTSGVSTYTRRSAIYKKALSVTEAAKLKAMMLSAVKNGTGRNAAIAGYDVGGKTGTAEVSSGAIKPNAWFVGFVDDHTHPIAICVVLEQGGSGGGNAAPVAGKALKKAIDLGVAK